MDEVVRTKLYFFSLFLSGLRDERATCLGSRLRNFCYQEGEVKHAFATRLEIHPMLLIRLTPISYLVYMRRFSQVLIVNKLKLFI